MAYELYIHLPSVQHWEIFINRTVKASGDSAEYGLILCLDPPDNCFCREAAEAILTAMDLPSLSKKHFAESESGSAAFVWGFVSLAEAKCVAVQIVEQMRSQLPKNGAVRLEGADEPF